MFDRTIQHARFVLPRPEVHPAHPFRDDKNHEALLQYLQQRLAGDDENRSQRVDKYSQIDRDVAAWMKLSDEDAKRAEKHKRDGTPQATAVALPLTWIHLDDMMTYYAQTFAPNRGMFYHTATPDDTEDASQLVALMNNHAVYGSYYRHLLRAIFNILKYNAGGLSNTWSTDYGPQLQVNPDGTTTMGSQPIFHGNKIHAIDMYNLFYDPSVELSQLHKDGEWFAMAEMRSHYWLKNKCLESQFFNCEDLFDSGNHTSHVKYYKNPPIESKLAEMESGGGSRVNWFSFMSGTESVLVDNAFELVTMYIKINPNDFGLIPGNRAARADRNRYETWRFVIANGDRIIEATHMNNIHGYLPAFFGVLNDDVMGDAAKSPAEILNPLQQFSSFLLNSHVQANRKNLYGTTFYDPSRVDYDKVPKGEVAARVPIKPQGFGQDIRSMVYHDNNVLDTKQTLQDLQGMIGIIDQFFPTQSLPSQIAGIDRAIDSQVAAVQQGSNRRQHKGARLLDDTLMRPLRFAMYYNIVQYQEDGETVADFFSGKTQTIDLQKLRDTSLIHLIGQGLKAIDRQQVAGQIRDVLFAMIQAPAVAERIDILAVLDYWTNMLDVDVNMKQFEIQQPVQPQVPGADAGGVGTGVIPATDPAKIAGGPIYGP